MLRDMAIMGVCNELDKLRHNAPPFTSYGEGATAIGQEYVEIEAEIDTPDPDGPGEALRDEVVKLAAQALRFLIDLC